MVKPLKAFLTFSMALMPAAYADSISDFKIDTKHQRAYAKIENDQLILNTGKVERRWTLTDAGLQTISLTDLSNKKNWITSPSKADWNYKGYTSKGELTNITAKVSDDQGFASEHIELTAEFKYPDVAVKYIVWAYPNSMGFRTQLKIKALKELDIKNKLKYDITHKHDEYNKTNSSQVLTGETEHLSIDTTGLTKRGIGYYNHTQGRNKAKTPLILEEVVKDGILGWASVVSLESDQGGLMIVKESHKCVNQAGVNTGVFDIKKNSIASTGWGILPQDLTNKYQGYWANWTILNKARKQSQRELAIKEFDRTRYPIDPERDIYIMANTWGSGESKNWSQSAAREENVLVEIDSQKDLGIDAQQVDDGWQGWMTYGKHWRPVPKLDFKEMMRHKKKDSEDGEKYAKNAKVYDMYPQGWGKIKQHAKDQNIRLGLWAHARIPLEDLKWNFDEAGFKSYKIDFVNASNFTNLNNIVDKIRQFALYTNHKIRVNWDVTEHPPRIGYYFGREYGNIYLENRKTKQPHNVVYIPHLVLRDAWQLSKYNNLNKFQISVQNGDRCNKEVSDAHKHRHDYMVAQTLMGSPIFFQETHYYSDEAREQIRPLLKAYRAVRDEMYKGYVFPIGDKPDNKSWSGFQNYNSNSSTGFLTVFRQIENKESQKSLKLKFLAGEKIMLTNLMTGKEEIITVGPEGEVKFSIERSADFLFCKYVKL